jgi:UDP-N-acetyl-D-galactosamine dehydrogenase
MGAFVADSTIKKMILANKSPRQSKVIIMGITFKENCPDTRNSKIMDIITELREYGIEPIIADPTADKDEALHEYGVTFTDISEIQDMDAVVIAVSHDEYVNMKLADFDSPFIYKENC